MIGILVVALILMVMMIVLIIVIIIVVMINKKNQQYLHPYPAAHFVICVRMLLLESVQNMLKEHQPAKFNKSILGIMQEQSKKILVGPVED